MNSQSEVEAEAQVAARDNIRRAEDLCASTIALGSLLRKAEDSVKRKRFAPLLGLRLSFIMEDVKQIIEDIETIDHAINDPECVIPPSLTSSVMRYLR